MRTLTLVLGLVCGAVAGLALAHWLGFDLLGATGAVAAAAAGLGGGIGLALARSSNASQRRKER